MAKIIEISDLKIEAKKIAKGIFEIKIIQGDKNEDKKD
jgi:hypothetical protein